MKTTQTGTPEARAARHSPLSGAFDTPMITRATGILLLGLVFVGQVQATDRLVGSWVKHRTKQEDRAYVSDTNWVLEVTFRGNGEFVWRSIRSQGTAVVDESVEGTYSTKRGLITYRFQNPSPVVRQRLPEYFAFWPSKLVGQQTYRFQDRDLILGHDGNKLWYHLKRKKHVGSDAKPDNE